MLSSEKKGSERHDRWQSTLFKGLSTKAKAGLRSTSTPDHKALKKLSWSIEKANFKRIVTYPR